MGERALGWGLRLLGLALSIGPFIVALGMHNWNIQAAVMPSEAEMAKAQESLTGIIGEGISENMFTMGLPTITSSTVRIPIQFTSPLKVPVKVMEVSGSVSDQGVQIAQVQMEEAEVEVPAGATRSITLVGTYTGGIPTNPQLSQANITFDLYGLTVQLQVSTTQGGS